MVSPVIANEQFGPVSWIVPGWSSFVATTVYEVMRAPPSSAGALQVTSIAPEYKGLRPSTLAAETFVGTPGVPAMSRAEDCAGPLGPNSVTAVTVKM